MCQIWFTKGYSLSDLVNTTDFIGDYLEGKTSALNQFSAFRKKLKDYPNFDLILIEGYRVMNSDFVGQFG